MLKIEKSNYTLKSNKIDNISIIHISDLHYDIEYNTKRLNILTKEISNVKPNYVCITGDILDNSSVLNNEKAYKIMYDFLENLCTLSTVIITLGNHELKQSKNYSRDYCDIIVKLKRIPNLILLDNEVFINDNICFVGFNPSYEYYDKLGRDYNIFNKDFDKLDIKLDKEKYNILLIHTPKDLLEDNIYNNRLNNFDLILAGHTHGGLMPVKFKGHMGIISPGKRFFPKNVRGHLIKEKTHLIICSGIVRLSNTSGIFHYFNFLYKMHVNYISIRKN